MKKGLEDKLIDTILEEAFSDEMLKDIDSIPDEPVETSAEFEAKMLGLIKSSGKKHIRPAQALKRAAVILLCFLSVSFIAVMFSPEVRASVQQIFLKVYGQFTDIIFDKNGDKVAVGNYEIGYLPDGYSLKEQREMTASNFSTFENDNGQRITFIYGSKNQVFLSVDNERHDAEPVQIHDSAGYLFEAEDEQEYNILIWTETDTALLLEGGPSEELIKIAESIRLK